MKPIIEYNTKTPTRVLMSQLQFCDVFTWSGNTYIYIGGEDKSCIGIDNADYRFFGISWNEHVEKLDLKVRIILEENNAV